MPDSSTILINAWTAERARRRARRAWSTESWSSMPGRESRKSIGGRSFKCGSQILHRTLAPLPGSHHVHREAAAFLSTFRAAATFAENWAPEAAGAGRSREAAARDRRKIFL